MIGQQTLAAAVARRIPVSVPLVLQLSYATDDSCQFQFYAEGHHSAIEMADAALDRIRLDERDIPAWVVRQAPVKQVWQRTVRSRAGENALGDHEFRHHDEPSRGAKPVTVMDLWFPLHAFKERPRLEVPNTEAELAKAVKVGRVAVGQREFDAIVVQISDLRLSCDLVNDRQLRLAAQLARSHGVELDVSVDLKARVAHALAGKRA